MLDRDISPGGSEFEPAMRFAESLVKFQPRGCDFSILQDRLMMNYFSSTFSKLFGQNIKSP